MTLLDKLRQRFGTDSSNSSYVSRLFQDQTFGMLVKNLPHQLGQNEAGEDILEVDLTPIRSLDLQIQELLRPGDIIYAGTNYGSWRLEVVHGYDPRTLARSQGIVEKHLPRPHPKRMHVDLPELGYENAILGSITIGESAYLDGATTSGYTGRPKFDYAATSMPITSIKIECRLSH